MVDVNPEIWENKTLGAASNGLFLDALEAQQQENRRAVLEEREPLTVKRENRYPGFEEGKVDSQHTGITFGDTYDNGDPVIPSTPDRLQPGHLNQGTPKEAPSRPSASPKPRAGTITPPKGSGSQKGSQAASEGSDGK